MTTLPSEVTSNARETTEGGNCRVCNEPYEADSQIVQCDSCNHWDHFRCAGVGASIAEESRAYLCAVCNEPPAESTTASTSASVREAKLRLEMQRLAEEKELRARVLAEREKQDKDMQEMVLRLEKERRDKAIADLMLLEKEFIEKKYQLLQARLEEDDDGKSTRSHRSARQGVDKVREWMNAQPATTLSSNPGEMPPTGLTSMASNVGYPVPPINASGGKQLVKTTSDISGVNSFAPLISPVTMARSSLPVETITSTPSNALPLQQSTPRSSAANVVRPVSSLPLASTLPSVTTVSVSTRPMVASNIARYGGHLSGELETSAAVLGMSSNQPPPMVPQTSIANLPVSQSIGAIPITRMSVPGSLNLSWAENGHVYSAVPSSGPANSTVPSSNSAVGLTGPAYSASGPAYSAILPNVPAYSSVLPNGTAYSAVPSGGPAYSSVLPVGSSYSAVPPSGSAYPPWPSGGPVHPSSVPFISQGSIPFPASSSSAGSRGIFNLPSQNYPGISVSSSQAPIFSMPQQASIPLQQPLGPAPHQLAARHVVSKELPSFSGNPAEWPLFWSSYDTSTQMCGYTDAENLMRLQRSLKGDARRAVSCFLLHPTNVTEVMNTLHSLYGRPEAIIHTLLNEVRATPSPKPEKLETLINFGLAVRNLCVHLVSTRQEMHLANPILLQELVEKLPANIKLDWALYRQRVLVADLRSFADYMNVLVTAASSVTTIGESHSQKNDRQKGKTQAFVNPHSAEGARSEWRSKEGGGSGVNSSETKVDRPCAVCKTNGHKPKDCETLKKKGLADRWKVANEVHLCKKCLYPHGRWPCKAPNCGVDGCQQRHHRLLHPGEPRVEGSTTNTSTTATSGTVAVHHHSRRQILFRIIPVSLYANGKSVQTFAFLDSGSDSTLLEDSIAKQLGIVGQPAPLCMQWTNGVKRVEEASQRVQLSISGTDSTKRFALNSVHTVKSLDLPQQSLRFEEFERDFPHLRGLPVKSYSDATPRILIGLDNTKVKTTLKLREGKPDEPVAAKTRIGWVVFGRSQGLDGNDSHRILHKFTQFADQELHDLVKDFFRVEGTGVTSPAALDSAEDRRAREILEATTVRTPSGRFQTGLLWKYDQVEFPDSRPMAERRLQCLEKRLQKSPELYANVKQQIGAYLEKGYAHLATDAELAETDPKQVWYLPLGVVVNPKKPEKVRVVWDAAAKVHGVSLNSVLLKGPDLLTSLPGVLSRYRQRQVAISADIREMFHQVLIRPEDRNAQRFLWRDGPSQPTQVYIMDVATFGSTCSPCSLQFVKNLNADEQADEFPIASGAVKHRHYVDDYLDSVDTVDEAVQLAEEVRTVHAKAGFEIRHWMSNSPEVIERIGENSESSSKQFVMDKCSSTERVLGMSWHPRDDVFSFSAQLRENLQCLMAGDVVPTKREALSLVMSFFDPLGLVAVSLVHGKVLLQDVWRAGVGWDESIPEDTFVRWKAWIQVLKQLDEVKIPRCYFPGYGPDAYDSLELHIFVDASESAYAACAYFRIVDNGAVRCCLVSAKTKVAPLKPLSIPRLELQAAIMGARLMTTITANHTLKIHRKVLWSDSTTVLSWLKSDSRSRTQFVAFRVGEILEVTDIKDWRWVPTTCNVADEATKWGAGPKFEPNSRWFKGPSFLYEHEDYWPQRETPLAETVEELRSAYVHHNVAVEQVIDFQRFSKWERLLRTVTFVRRFYENCRRKIRKEPTSSATNLGREELRNAEFTIWRLVQLDAFPAEFAILQKNRNEPLDQQQKIRKSSHLYAKCPVIGEGELIRMERRTREADWISNDVKFPVILPKANYVSFLLADWYHRTYRHANGETVVNEIVQKYSIPALRVLVRRVTRRCNWCRVYKAKPETPRMGPLPAVRLTPYVRPFSFVGLDYFGPILVRIGRSNAKRWVALFTCLTVRAIHLEIVSGLSTESCKMAIRRFIGRRGAPIEIYSDQGTNFQGANRELQEEIQSINNTLAGTFTNTTTQWKFNPPYAPHMGGAWERLVRSVKAALGFLPAIRNPDEETLATVMVEIESMVNTRPLTYMPLESSEHESLTPNHFILLSSSGVTQPLALPTDSRAALRSNWNLARVMLDRFWTRWIQEYLPIISKQTKWFGEARNLRVGDLVVIVQDNVRNSWTRGKVVRVYPGPDGRVRKADIQTSTGITQRPATLLAVLDVQDPGDGLAEETSCNTGGGVLATRSSTLQQGSTRPE